MSNFSYPVADIIIITDTIIIITIVIITTITIYIVIIIIGLLWLWQSILEQSMFCFVLDLLCTHNYYTYVKEVEIIIINCCYDWYSFESLVLYLIRSWLCNITNKLALLMNKARE